MENKLRLRFAKTGKAKYFSHLDLMTVMRRALLRAGVKLRYSNGFNPHPYMSAALPLPVGTGSVCELMDIGAEDGGTRPELIPKEISGMLPEGIELLDVYSSERKFSGIKWMDITGVMRYDAGAGRDLAASLKERYSEKSIIVSKKTKSGVSDIDIAPLIRDIAIEENGEPDELVIKAKVRAQDPTISPGNLLGALRDEYAILVPDFASFTRNEIYDEGLAVFR